ncbi:MAG TPA: BTAD domain-containing putative transcriptional regulator [Acidimicrobiales bacterium]|nr:BTAD domain-containing putative transcriptional regulator [Acidimicrobiales bacterium]
MEIRLLGPVEVLSARGPVPIGSAKQRALLAFLALQPRRLVTNDALIDGLWGDDPPDGTVKALRFHVSRLRVILRQADAADELRTRPHGYLLAIADDAVDVGRFERAVAGARLARSEGAAPAAVSAALRDALALWTGPALADINGAPFVVGERRRLEELRLAATEDYLAAELAAGRDAEAVGELERMVDRHPLRERLWELLITALYKSGRQADALAAYQRLRRRLADELGIEPSAPLRQLERNVLLQDAVLVAPSTSPGPVSPWDGDEPPTDTADEEPPPPGNATGGPSRVLATISLALGIVALALFWLGIASTLIAVIAVACGAIAAGRATMANGRVGWTATTGIIAGVVALSASSGLALYRHVTADSETATDTEVSGEGPAGGREVPLSTLQIGQCFNLPPSTGSSVPESVWLVPCERPHEAEVYHLFVLAPGPYPGDEEVDARARQQCSTAFDLYVGVGPDRSALDFGYVWPGQYLWESGDRGGGCALFHRSGRDLTGSMRGTRQ